MIRPTNETKDLLLSVTKNCETLIKQTHTKPEVTLEIKLTKSKQTFHFNPSINFGLHSNRMIGLINLEVYNSIFNITEENNKFELYTDTFDQFSFTELKDELKEFLDNSNISNEPLRDEEIGPPLISA